MQLKPEEISKIIRAQIKHYENVIEQSETGTVIMVGDGIARASGLDKLHGQASCFEFDDGEYGMAQNLEENTRLHRSCWAPMSASSEGSTVKRTGKVVSVPVGEALIGRVVNALGQPIDGTGPIDDHRVPGHREPGPRHHRAPARSRYPLQTGIKAIDSMIPIGRGQRELIIGDRQTGKTAIAIGYHHQPEGQGRHLHLCRHRPEALDRGAAGAEPDSRRRRDGLHHRRVRDGLRAGAAAVHRALFRLRHGRIFHAPGQGRAHHLRRPEQARRGLPCPFAADPPSARDVRPTPATCSICTPVCWSARRVLAPECGGGSMTALPIIETQAGDVSAYIPTNVISITDGQIFLETELFHSGVMPAVNPGISVSRVGGNAQIKAMKKVAGTLKLLYSQYRELQSLRAVRLAIWTRDTKARLAQGERIVEVLKQNRNAPVPRGAAGGHPLCRHPRLSGQGKCRSDDARDYEKRPVRISRG